MSSFYKSETSYTNSFSDYMYIGSMNCTLASTPLNAQECPQQTMDFTRNVTAASAAAPQGVSTTLSSPGYNALGSAYPNIVSMPFKLYQDTKY